jgi:hypothetical protein
VLDTIRKRFREEETPTTILTEVKVTGRRSPRWAIWSKMLIPCQSGIQYLARLRIIQTPWFGVYLHDIYEPDGDRDPHNHPWKFISIVLRGYYVERVYPDPAGHPHYFLAHMHKRFSAHRMDTTSAHRIVTAAPGLKTLILTGKRQSGWGFYRDGEYISWQDYEELIRPKYEKGEAP